MFECSANHAMHETKLRCHPSVVATSVCILTPALCAHHTCVLWAHHASGYCNLGS